MQRDKNESLASLAEQPALKAQMLELTQKNFPQGSPLDRPIGLAEEFPLLLDEKNSARQIVLAHEGRAVSAAAYRVFEVQVPGARRPLRVAGIGLVVTDPAARGQGLATRVQAEIETRARQEGCELSVLWSDLVRFYTNLGYVVAGSECQWQLDPGALALLRQRLAREVSSKFEVRPLADWREALPLYNAQGLGPSRDAALYAKFLALPRTWGFGAYRHGRLEAYALVGKSRDLRDTLHELIGARDAVGPLLQAAQAVCERGLRVHQPSRAPLQEEIEHWLGPAERSALAFFKVLDTIKFADWLQTAGILPAGARLRVQAGSEQRAEQVLLERNGRVFFQSDDAGHLIQLFLGPWLIEEMQDLPALVARELGGTRVPPIYFWGFDSV